MEDCRDQCFRLGSDLASILNQDENDFLVKYISERPARDKQIYKVWNWLICLNKINNKSHSEAAWIGAYISQVGGSFSWMDGSDWGYTNWDPGLNEFNKYSLFDYCLSQSQGSHTDCRVSWGGGTTVCTWGQTWGSSAGGGMDLVSGSDLPWTVSVRSRRHFNRRCFVILGHRKWILITLYCGIYIFILTSIMFAVSGCGGVIN